MGSVRTSSSPHLRSSGCGSGPCSSTSMAGASTPPTPLSRGWEFQAPRGPGHLQPAVVYPVRRAGRQQVRRHGLRRRPLARSADHPTENKKRFLVDEYRRRLAECGFDFQLTFELTDEGGHSLFLVYGTSSIQGVRKMKDAMWSVTQRPGRTSSPSGPEPDVFRALR